MTGMKDMFGDTLCVYPLRPGWKEPTTSRAAAEQVAGSAATLRGEVLAEITRLPATADEIAARLKRSVLSIRPRVAELHKLGKIRRAPDRRTNVSGMSAAVWVLA